MASRKITDSSDPTGPDRSVTGPGRVHATQALAVILLAAATLSATFAARELRRPRHLRGCDDPALRRVRVGVQVIGDDYTNTPPAHALSRRGIVGNVVGYTVYGDYAQPDPPARIIDAVAKGDIDVAIAWGPLAGYFAPRQAV